MTNLAALPIGTRLAEDYRIDRVLGAGGFGITYLAEETPLARQVTIKEYFPVDFAVRDTNQAAQPRSGDVTGDYQWGLVEKAVEAPLVVAGDVAGAGLRRLIGVADREIDREVFLDRHLAGERRLLRKVRDAEAAG